MNMQTHVCIYINVCKHISIYTGIYIYWYLYVYIYMYIYMCVNIQIYIYILESKRTEKGTAPANTDGGALGINIVKRCGRAPGTTTQRRPRE